MIEKKINSDSTKLCEAIVEGMKDNKANDIVVLDLRKLDGDVWDFFVLCRGVALLWLNFCFKNWLG